MKPAKDPILRLRSIAYWWWRNGLNVVIGLAILALLALQSLSR